MSRTTKKSIGRPPTGKGEQLQLRLHRPMLERLDDWRAKQRPIPNRQDAIRIILAKTLGGEPS